MKTITFAAAMVVAVTLSTFAQNRFIPVRVINEALGITTPRPAYYLRASLTDATDAYFWAIGDYTNTRNNYDSLGFYSGVWRLRLADNQWLAIDRLSGFPYAARWVEEVQYCNPVYFPDRADRDAAAPLFLWGWTIRDTTKISPRQWKGSLLTYNPYNRGAGAPSVWRSLDLPVPPNRYHDWYHALGTTRLPTPTTPSVAVFSSSFMRYPDERSFTGYYAAVWLDIYTGSVIDDSLHRRWSVTVDTSSRPYFFPLLFNPAIGSDSALYSIALVPAAASNQFPPPVRPFYFYRYNPTTGTGEHFTPRSGITKLTHLPSAYVWSRDSSIYVLCAPQPSFTDDPSYFRGPGERSDTMGKVAVLRYDINTGHCERVLAIGSQEKGDAVWLGWGLSYTTPYKNGIATIGSEQVGDSIYPTIYILQHTANKQMILQQRIILKDIFPDNVYSLEFPYSLSAWGERLVATTYAGVYIIEPARNSVRWSDNQDATVYPLPARAGQTVFCTLPPTEETVTIASAQLYDGTGKNMPVSVHWSDRTVSIPTATLARGTYWLVIVTDQGTRWLRPVMIE